MNIPLNPSDEALRMGFLAATLLRDFSTVFVGIGAPCLAAMIAKRTHSPNLELIFESGVIGADPDRMPLSTGSPSVALGASMIGSMLDVFAKLQRGEIDLGLLSGAQVDRHGNLNSTVIGEYASPKVRLPGSGGAHDIAMLARDVVILMPHNPERFVKSISFVTSPGHFPARSRTAGLGGGPMALVTDRAIFHFQDGKMTLTGLYGDNSAEHAVEGIPWKIPKAKSIERIDPPSPELSNLVRKFLGENK